MLYFKKLKPLEITHNTGDLLIIERPKNLNSLYVKLFIYITAGIASLFFTFEYYKSIQSASSFLLMACSVPIIYLFISASKLVSEIRGWKMEFDKQKGYFFLNSKKVCTIKDIKAVVYDKIEKGDEFKNWIKYKLLIQSSDGRKIVLAISSKTEIIERLANAVSLFLSIELSSTINNGGSINYTKTKIYKTD